ncbi:hypothetical protein [Methylobacterium longum]|uniref:Uncharacterized protein n=1 Tax=Methylobacterium longum TaxID=767694 RepID=A0ABT8AHN6_9HYPH|nr:hypothetical protein [Methylobacterium longum]MDN3569254.1 hypothetical protein [Methylobacterium longum]
MIATEPRKGAKATGRELSAAAADVVLVGIAMAANPFATGRGESAMSAEDVRKAMLDLMDAISDQATRTEMTADVLMHAAEQMFGEADAEAMRDAVRRQQVSALELRGRLAALRHEYAERFPLER